MANYYKFTLKANQAITVPIAGKVILVDSLGAAPGLDITPVYQGQTGITMPQRQAAFKVWVDYDNVVLASPVDCTVALFLSMSDVSLGFTNGSSINVQGQVSINNGAGARVPVDLGGGNVQVTATNVGINNNLTTLSNTTAGVMKAGAQVFSDATMKRLRFRNADKTAIIALGGVGVTLANAAIQLKPGDVWLEDDAPGATWYAVSDTDNVSLQIMGLK